MQAIIEVLEQELEEAFEVKNKKSLHRYIVLLTENIVKKESYEKQQLEIKNDIKTLAELMKQGFESMDKRFESLQHQMDNRFESLQHQMDKRFESLQHQMDKRFESLQHQMDKRFNAADKRFDDMNKRINFMNWFVPSIITLVVVILKFL
ncbi:MAG: hypothetical protein GXP33_02025 [Spirochaetes bacterium]|nr:hypothetical protein [Spirochaetota bacterium]